MFGRENKKILARIDALERENKSLLNCVRSLRDDFKDYKKQIEREKEEKAEKIEKKEEVESSASSGEKIWILVDIKGKVTPRTFLCSSENKPEYSAPYHHFELYDERKHYHKCVEESRYGTIDGFYLVEKKQN